MTKLSNCWSTTKIAFTRIAIEVVAIIVIIIVATTITIINRRNSRLSIIANLAKYMSIDHY